MTVPMIAKRLFGYSGRDIQHGSHFEAESERDAKLLFLTGRADYRTAAVDNAPVQKPMTAGELERMRNAPPVPGGDNITVVEQGVKLAKPDDLAELRAEYEAKVRKRPFMGWDAETLRAKMAAHASAPATDTADE